MHGYGSDRVRPGKGEQRVLFSRFSKSWKARVPKMLTSAEHPGTAVLWDDQYFEVVEARPSGEGVRYVLEPWRDHHTIRLSERYDEESEAERERQHRAALTRNKGRKAANLLGILTGHLPAAVQEHLASELGILPTRLTFLSMIIPLTFIGWVVHQAVGRKLNNEPPVSLVLLLIAGYLGAECGMRLQIVWSQSRPIGSAAGFIAYSIFYLLSPNKARLVKLTEVRRGDALFTLPPPDDVAQRDALTLREPWLTLLSSSDQQKLAQKFGFDHRAQGYKVAAIILVFALAGVWSSLATLEEGGIGKFISLLVAAVLAGEQIVRLSSMRRGPAGSILGLLVRPFAKKLLR